MAAPAARSTAWLFRNDVLKARPREDRKNSVVEAQEGEVLARLGGRGRADAAHDHGDDERQEQERQKELASPSGRGHGRKQSTDRREADIREHDGRDEGPRHRPEEKRERGKRDDLSGGEEGHDAEALAEPDRAPLAGGEHEPVEDALFPL